MRYCLLVVLFALGGCGSVDAYDNARSASEMFYLFKANNGIPSKEAVGNNPYDNDPRYRMAYCKIGKQQHWSSVAACQEKSGEPQI